MMEFTWTEQLAPRSRAAWLVFFRAGEARPFNGRDIPGWCVVRARQLGPRKGKWTATVWRLALADGVLPVSGHYGWDTGDFPEGLWSAIGKRGPIPASWAEWEALLASTLGVPAEGARELLRAMDPEVAAAWDAAEEKIRTLLGGGGEPQAAGQAAAPEPHPAAERNLLLLAEKLPHAAGPSTVVTVEIRPRRGAADYSAPLEVVAGGQVVGLVVPLPPGPAAIEPNEFWWAAAQVAGAASFAKHPAVAPSVVVWFELEVPEGAELRQPALRRAWKSYVIEG
jgi:hypothetical protein